MAEVVFVAPFLLPTTVRFIDAMASVEGVRLGLISQDSVEKLPAALRGKLAAHWRIDDGLSSDSIASAARSLAGRLGSIDQIVGTLEELQVPLAEVRERLGIGGMGVRAARNFRDKSQMKT